ncbi:MULTISPECIES: ADP-ribosylglycohydrolase family protein [Trichocoleus]|uniref:ADP-ribosylglycohydrolase family protein n=1 Tax=Trichocoleus desertorum GB2-A4 TaxID=2933944 RepID=A0ABV0J9K8_9CYAN|nr:ADP-ribosylglycohydrolase family protein [Trichocoleus sp. FACHB-46]MBD1862799.1 ADP-ribosylglycohydrolase family protein [Trichocoleus sp. FACHB-46]
MQNSDRLGRAQDALVGLSVGDAFGENFFRDPKIETKWKQFQILPAPSWSFTDDTQMALSVVAILRRYGEIQPDALVASFAQHYDAKRGYGRAMGDMLAKIRSGQSWQALAASLFQGQGSFGNGAAMRVAPLGAYFADDLDAVVEQAKRSAVVTHTHLEAIAGAIAVAVATAWAWRFRMNGSRPSHAEFLTQVLSLVPPSKVRSLVQKALDLPADTKVLKAVAVLGNGSHISAQDTVPFALWCAATHLDNYEAALWLTSRGFGDVDTTCAIVGGIVAAYSGVESIPAAWLTAREPLPNWPFEET